MQGADATKESDFPKGLLYLLSSVEPATMARIRRLAYRLLPQLAPAMGTNTLRAALKPLPASVSVTIDVIDHNLAVAYLETARRGRLPQPSAPTRDERLASPRELLAEAFIAVVDADRDGYVRALLDLVDLAERGTMLTEADLERPR